MSEFIQRIFQRSDSPAMSLNTQAALGPVRQPERSQVSHLVHHFLERFFNHETASVDGDAKARMVLIACAAGLPGFVVAMYLWPIYHPMIISPHSKPPHVLPSYWLQVNHHFFFVTYSFVAMGLAVVYEWDMFFPDLLDVLVLGALPISRRRIFLARVAAIAVLVFGFLIDANFLAPMTLVAATDPPNMPRFLVGHCVSVLMAGLFSAAAILAFEGMLITILGERLFQRISLAVQGVMVTVLVIVLLLFPVLSGVTPALLQSHSAIAMWLPPYWFLGVDQWFLEGASVLPVYVTLAKVACVGTLMAAGIATATYPIAYFRRERQLVEGSVARSRARSGLAPLRWLLHRTAVRSPERRAVYHFIQQTLQRVPRYRIYLVLYGGVGLSILVATVLRLTVRNGRLHAEISADGIRASIGMVAFWAVAGLRTTFGSPGNRQGSWIWRFLHGSPPQFAFTLEKLLAARVWVIMSSTALTISTIALFHIIAPAELPGFQSTIAQLIVAAGMCLLLTDFGFLHVVTAPFTGGAPQTEDNLAFTLLRFFTFFPLTVWLSEAAEQWIEANWLHAGAAVMMIAVAHLWLRWKYRDVVRIHCDQIELEEGEDDFPMKLGLRY
ncbi:hypothetical protein [Terracidiphilus sp.]|uniref:hypothetical protein n=1 Tax=Terracidiphilus sp. TaxID=1964191 RepID=UPI003C1D5E8C